MKLCATCKQKKPILEFSKNPNKRDGHNYTCKLCSRKYFKEYYRNNKDAVNNRNKKQDTIYKERIHSILRSAFANGCEICGESDIRTLEFAHLDRTTKRFNISTAVAKQRSINEIKEEIKRCKILCANCHKKETHTEDKSWRTK